MLIEQNFELGGPGLPGCICTPITGCFHDKIISKENFRVDCYLLLNAAGGNALYFPLPGPNLLRNLTPNCKILNAFWI